MSQSFFKSSVNYLSSSSIVLGSNNLHLIQSKNLPVVLAKGDSGASDHYFRPEDQHCLSDLRAVKSPPIMLPDHTTLQGSEMGTLPFDPGISQKACEGKVLPGLKSSSLISIGKLCDDGCKVLFDDERMYAIKNKNSHARL